MPKKVSTFSESVPLEEADREKEKLTSLGKALRKADLEYLKRKR
mgnify:CR=1 FL=1